MVSSGENDARARESGFTVLTLFARFLVRCSPSQALKTLIPILTTRVESHTRRTRTPLTVHTAPPIKFARSLGARSLTLYALVRSFSSLLLLLFRCVISDDAGICAGRTRTARHRHLGRTSNDRSYVHCKRAQGTGDARAPFSGRRVVAVRAFRAQAV